MTLSRLRLPLILLLALFILLRLPGLDVPYHQDEYKAATLAGESLAEASAGLTHPPLLAVLLRADAVLFGSGHMRVLPVLFGLASAVLLYLVVRRRVGEMAARFALGLYAVSFYGVWSSLMVDVDGAILPFFFLLALYTYDRFLEGSKKHWAALLLVACILGLLTKLSFVLVIGTLILDYVWHKRASFTRKDLSRGALVLLCFTALVVCALLAARHINPAFRFDGMIEHALYYIQSESRSFLQVFIQGLKAVYYLSPLLLAPLLLSHACLSRLRPFLIYIGVGAFFYFVLFDFSHGALDKYLMFLIIPLAALSGAALTQAFEGAGKRSLVTGALLGAFLSVLILWTAFLDPAALPLYPKSAWFSSILQGNLNVLTPFTGGSGPVGFYISFLFIVLSFVASAVLAVIALRVTRIRALCAAALVVIGLSYNAVFIEEFSYGALYGNAGEALKETLALAATHGVPPLITYNDYGAYELSQTDHYAGRFYATPQFEASHVERFNEHVRTGGGHFMVIGFPPLYEGFYTTFFARCATVASTTTGVIQSSIYLCTQASE